MEARKSEEPRSYNFEAIKNSETNIILFGTVGHGKTSLLNKFCGTDYLTASRGFSCTRNIQCSPSVKYDMLFIDFPGLNASRDILEHIIEQRDTLKLIPVRTICFIIKFDNRYDMLLNSISQMALIFKNHIPNVCIIFTHCEDVDITQQAEVGHIIQEDTAINPKNLFFSSLNTDPYALLPSIYGAMCTMDNIGETVIESAEIIRQFKSNVNSKYESVASEFEKQFKDVLELHKKEFNKSDDKDLKRALYFSLKQQKDRVVDGFKIKLETHYQLEINQVITQVILFQNAIYNDFVQFKSLAERSLIIQSVNYKGEKNRYKKCVGCGRIWFKVYGCDSIVCGKRSVSKDSLLGRFANYTINYIGGVLRISKNEENKEGQYVDKELIGLTPEEECQNLGRKVKIKPEGCGMSLKWTEMEDVTDSVIQDLKKLEDSDYYSNIDDNLKFKTNENNKPKNYSSNTKNVVNYNSSSNFTKKNNNSNSTEDLPSIDCLKCGTKNFISRDFDMKCTKCKNMVLD